MSAGGGAVAVVARGARGTGGKALGGSGRGRAAGDDGSRGGGSSNGSRGRGRGRGRGSLGNGNRGGQSRGLGGGGLDGHLGLAAGSRGLEGGGRGSSHSLGLEVEVAGRVGRGARVQRAAGHIGLGGSHAATTVQDIAELAGAGDVPDAAGVGVVAGQAAGLDDGVGVSAAGKVSLAKGRGGQEESRGERSNSHG